MTSKTLAAAAAFTALTPFAAHAQSNTPAPIEQTQLNELNAWSVGAISRANGALGADLWAQSDPAVLATVMDRLPAVYESPAAQALARRVLLSGGEAPVGDSTAAARKRFEALGKMGAADELAQMAAGSGTGLSDVLIAQYAAQAELARGRRAEACARGRSASSTGETLPSFILRLRAYCAAVGGDRAAADLALELAAAQNASDAWYTAAVAAAGGAPGARPPAARYDNSLSAQLSLAGNLRPGANPLNNASTLALVALARAENAPQPQRVQAAALAFRRSAISAREARTIFEATPAEITRGLPPIVTAVRRVLPSPTAAGPEAAGVVALENARAIADVLRQSTSPADFSAAARLFRTDIADVRTSDAAAAVLYARAAVTLGDGQLSQRLIASAREAGATEAQVAPLEAALIALRGPASEQAAMALQRRIDATPGAGARGAARDVTILAALGAPVDATVQAFLLATPTQGGVPAEANAIQALEAAVQRGAVGEGALLAVVAAGEGGPARLDTPSLERIIRALRGLRLDEDARRIAAEALLAGAPTR